LKHNGKNGREFNKAVDFNLAYFLPQVIFEADREGRLTFINHHGFQICGYGEEDLVEGLYVFDLVVPGEKEQVLRSLKLCLNGQPVNNVHSIVRKDGSTFPAIVSMSPVTSPDGSTGIVGVGIDITDCHSMQEKLVASETRLQKQVSYLNTLIENMNEAFITYDRQGCITFANKKAGEMSGYHPDEMRGKNLLEFVHPDYRELAAEKVRQRLGLENRDSYEAVLLHRDGGSKFMILNTSPIMEDGVIQGGMVVAEDVTERRKTEEQLRYLTLHDSLTGLYNRTFFEEEMRRLSCGRYHPVGLIICDVNGLKLVNDTLGHNLGDELLKVTAQVLRQSFRENDTVARIGGDEFAILLPVGPKPVLEGAVSRVKAAITQYNAEHPELPLSISMGLAVSSGSPPDMAELFKEADNQMYRQKLSNSRLARSSLVNSLMNDVLDKLNKD
jgi:diguanylate cyclase (GGDEF)-like protein/PAS domain S-box-containing protein